MPVLVGILRGSFVFLADLVRQISIPLIVDFMTIEGYGGGKKHTGTVKLLSDLHSNIEGKDVILVEDIVDTGRTMRYLISLLRIKKPKSLSVCVLLDKKERRVVDMDIPYVGFVISDVFVVGYGLDYKQKYRNLRDIFILE